MAFVRKLSMLGQVSQIVLLELKNNLSINGFHWILGVKNQFPDKIIPYRYVTESSDQHLLIYTFYLNSLINCSV